MLLYSGLLTVALAAWTLRYLLPILRTPGGRKGLIERFGRNASALAPAVAGKRVIWVQAVSVGEVLAASRLINELEAALGEGWRVVVSTTTKTGQALAKEKFGADRVFYMPLDFAFSVRAYLRVLKPAAVVLIESEVWPRMMHECRKLGAPVIVVNARVSDRSFNRSLKVRWIWSRVLRQATLWLAQSEEDARRLIAMGARADAVKVGGNLKYDIHSKNGTAIVEHIQKLAAGRRVIVAGSTLGNAAESEEAIFLRATSSLWHDFPVLYVIAPRHPERFTDVFNIAAPYQWIIRATDLLRGELLPKHVNIIVLDTIGDLASVYSLADVAFIGGSLVHKGGHNPLEPAQHGVPTIIGPSFENFREIVATLQANDAIKIVEDEAALLLAICALLENREQARAMGERGRSVYESQQGATARAVEAIVSMIGAKP
jgi:3-deoxy-D-manno-octulosonic-acid transferase